MCNKTLSNAVRLTLSCSTPSASLCRSRSTMKGEYLIVLHTKLHVVDGRVLAKLLGHVRDAEAPGISTESNFSASYATSGSTAEVSSLAASCFPSHDVWRT